MNYFKCELSLILNKFTAAGKALPMHYSVLSVVVKGRNFYCSFNSRHSKKKVFYCSSMLETVTLLPHFLDFVTLFLTG